MAKVIVLDSRDNVATAIEDIGKGDEVQLANARLKAVEAIPFGHKIALSAIPHGKTIVKYGESIGLAEGDIAAGAYVHVHNVDSQRGRGDKGAR